MPLATPRLPRARGRLSLALDWGRPHSLTALAQVVLLRAEWRPTVDWLRGWRGPGAR